MTPALHLNRILVIHGLALALDGAIAVTDFLAAIKASVEEEVPENNSTNASNSTNATSEGYYWARLNLLN